MKKVFLLLSVFTISCFLITGCGASNQHEYTYSDGRRTNPDNLCTVAPQKLPLSGEELAIRCARQGLGKANIGAVANSFEFKSWQYKSQTVFKDDSEVLDDSIALINFMTTNRNSVGGTVNQSWHVHIAFVDMNEETARFKTAYSLNSDNGVCHCKIPDQSQPQYNSDEDSDDDYDDSDYDDSDYDDSDYDDSDYDDSEYNDSGYILPNSNSKKLTKSDLSGLSKSQLRLARNEIYARHGRRFDDSSLQAYFDSQSWYIGTTDPEDFVDKYELSSIERRNARFIKKFE